MAIVQGDAHIPTFEIKTVADDESTRAKLFFLLLLSLDFLSLVLLSEGLDDIEDDDDVDGEDGEDGRGDGGDWRLVLPVLQKLLGPKEDTNGQEEHQHGVE